MENACESDKAPVWVTIFYTPLFFIVLWATWLWWALLESSSLWNWLSFFTWSWVLVSIPLCVFLMWFNYFKKQYEKIDHIRRLPLFAFAAFFIANLALGMVAKILR